MLNMAHLYATAAISGILALFFELAATAYIPSLVGRERLMAANGTSAQSDSIAAAAGPALAGGLIQLLTAPVALARDALSFAFAALCVARVRTPEPPPARAGTGRLRAELGAGVRLVPGDPALHAMVGTASLGSLAGAVQQIVLVLYLVRELGLAPTTLGIAFTVNGVASIAGALLAKPAGARLGPASALLVGTLVWSIAALLLPLAGRSAWRSRCC